ncbi:hypothetical protein HL670_01841 [Serratia plymuthica]|nr:hypothetical protein HL670_01841 [Serratia plymuthica]
MLYVQNWLSPDTASNRVLFTLLLVRTSFDISFNPLFEHKPFIHHSTLMWLLVVLGYLCVVCQVMQV